MQKVELVDQPTPSTMYCSLLMDNSILNMAATSPISFLYLCSRPKLVHLCILEVMDLIHGSIFFLVIPTARCSICYPGSSYRKLKLLAVIY
jgi:hypothetical protein